MTGKAVALDFTRFYPSIQKSKTQLPNCVPVAKTLLGTTWQGALGKFGLYRALMIVRRLPQPRQRHVEHRDGQVPNHHKQKRCDAHRARRVHVL